MQLPCPEREGSQLPHSRNCGEAPSRIRIGRALPGYLTKADQGACMLSHGPKPKVAGTEILLCHPALAGLGGRWGWWWGPRISAPARRQHERVQSSVRRLERERENGSRNLLAFCCMHAARVLLHAARGYLHACTSSAICGAQFGDA